MSCYDFGIINNYNLFTLGDVSQSGSDIEGRVAVGGNLKLTNMGIGDRIVASYGVDNTLVVGGNLTWVNGTNKAGNTVMRSTGVYSVSGVAHENATATQPKRPNPFPIDFVSSFNSLKCASTEWSKISSSGNTFISNCYGTIFLVGNSPTLNVFKFDANQIAQSSNILGGAGNTLQTINGISIIAPEGSTILINVSGSNVVFGSYQIFRNTSTVSSFPTSASSFCGTFQPGSVPTASQKSKILWNFYQATSLKMSTTSIQGSILAPLATLKTGGSNIEGNVMVNNIDDSSGSTELHYYPFSGCLPLVNCSATTTTTTTSTTTTTTTTTSTTTTTTTAYVPKISTLKYASSGTVVPGEIITYTIVVTNKTNSPITNLKLVDTLDLNTKYIPQTSNVLINTSVASFVDTSTSEKIIITLSNSLPAYSTAIFTFKVKVNPSSIIDTKIINSALLTATELTYPIKTNETSVFVQFANLNITKEVDKVNVECGQSLTYTFTIKNTGNINANNVLFRDFFESEFEFNTSNIIAPVGSTILKESNNSLSITIPNIPSKGIVTIVVPGVVKCCSNK